MKMIHSDPDFLKALEEAARRGPTAEERHLQKISFIASSLSDDNTTVTPDQVERELRRMAGSAA